jgi:cellular nucleic acid-binding protein
MANTDPSLFILFSPLNPVGAQQAKVYLASKPSLEDRRLLFDSPVPVKALTELSDYFRAACAIGTEAPEGSIIAQVGPDQYGRVTSFAPAKIVKLPDATSITIMGGDALADKAFKIVIRCMLNSYRSGETEQISEKLSFTDLTHCMGVTELLALPMAMKDQVYQLLAKMADDQVPLADVKALYADAAIDHPARAMVVESVGNAYLQKRLKNANAYYEYSGQNEEFKKDLQQYIAKHKTPFSDKIAKPVTGMKGQDFADATKMVNLANSQDFKQEAQESNMKCGTQTTANTSSCANEAFKQFEPANLPARIISFDGPNDEWNTVGPAAGDQWSSGAADWKDTSVPAGGLEDTWTTTGGEVTDNNGWGNDSGRAGDTAAAAAEDDNACRRCKKSGHYARECPEPRNDTCFNCGQPGHMSRECTEPKKPRGDDRTCRKCNEVGHIARDCPTAGTGGGERACHKCGEVGHISRDCTSSAFGASAGGAGGGMKCYNCQQYGHKSSECINEPVERVYGSDPRTCNKCSQKGHISRDCREEGGDSYSMQQGGGSGDQYNAGYGGGDGGYDGQVGIDDFAVGAEDIVEAPREEIITQRVPAVQVRKPKKGRPGYLDITGWMYDPHSYEGPETTASYGSGEHRGGGGRGIRAGRGRGRGRGGRRDGDGNGGRGGDFANENVPPPAAEEVPTVAVEGDWAATDAPDSSATTTQRW